MDPEDLIGHTWEVVEIDGEPVSQQQPPSVEFTSDGRVVGNTGANRLMGGYGLSGDRMQVSQLATTMMAGRPEAMRTETQLVQALGAGGDLEVQIYLRNAHSGNSLRLRRIANTRPVAQADPGTARAAAADGGAAAVEDVGAEDIPAEDEAAANGAAQHAAEPVPVPAEPIVEGPPAVRGNVLYRERIALPAGAVVTVRLLDTSRADAPASIIGEQVIAEPANVPVGFEIGYEPSTIDATHSYAVAATIEVDGHLAWRSTIHHPVLTRGAGPSATIMVTRAG
jgi:putative lipoprotein